ncbi:hypothetical protein BDZ97DRAFT_2028593 [Flammula alnicola]|nr:hypothetical protein BDZ97DRAFT_2028593 [Flammula alnicola]
MFDNACNVLVTGGSFISQKRGMNGIQYLVQAIATSAIHDSDERYDPPKCHPETRKTILEDIMAWIRNPSRSKRVLRLHGPAGAGKSAISQTIADLCQEFGLLAASFFFSRTSRERNTGSRLFSTLAYQLAIKVPQLKELIEEVIESDPAIVSKSMELQLKHLILEPLGQLRQASPQPLPQVIIIDGLDECIGFGECTPDKHQMDILQFILQALEDVKFPFCFIIASRPEFHILSQFDSPAYSQVTWRISLDNRKDVKEDIRVVLRSGFDGYTITLFMSSR